MSGYNTRSRKSNQGIGSQEDFNKLEVGVQKQQDDMQSKKPETVRYRRHSSMGESNAKLNTDRSQEPQNRDFLADKSGNNINSVQPTYERGDKSLLNTTGNMQDVFKKEKVQNLKRDLLDQLRQDNSNFPNKRKTNIAEPNSMQNDQANPKPLSQQAILAQKNAQRQQAKTLRLQQQIDSLTNQEQLQGTKKQGPAQSQNQEQQKQQQQKQDFQMSWFQEQFQKLSYNEIMQLVSSNQDFSSVISTLSKPQGQQYTENLSKTLDQQNKDSKLQDFNNSKQVFLDSFGASQSQSYESPTKQLLGYNQSGAQVQSSPKYSNSPNNNVSGSVFRTQKYNILEASPSQTADPFQPLGNQALRQNETQNVTITNTSRVSQQEEFVMQLWNKKWSNNPIQWAFSAMQIIYSFIPTIQQIWATDSLEQAIQMQTQNRLLGLTKQVKSVLLWEDVQLTTKVFVVGFYLTLFIWQIMQGTRLIRPFTTFALVLFVALIANFIFVVRVKADNLRKNNFSRQIKEAVRTRNTALIVRVQKFTIHLLSKLASYIIPVTVALVTLFVKELYSGSLTPTLAFGAYLWILACISETRLLSQTSLIVFLYVSAFSLPCGYARFKSRLDKMANTFVKVSVDYLDPKYRAAHVSALVVGLVAMTGLGINGLVLKTTVGFAAGVMFLFWRICVINKDITGHDKKEEVFQTKRSGSNRITIEEVNKQPNVVKGNIGPKNRIEITEINNQTPKIAA